MSQIFPEVFPDLPEHPSVAQTREVCERLNDLAARLGEECYHFTCGATWVIERSCRVYDGGGLSPSAARSALVALFECQGLGEEP